MQEPVIPRGAAASAPIAARPAVSSRPTFRCISSHKNSGGKGSLPVFSLRAAAASTGGISSHKNSGGKGALPVFSLRAATASASPAARLAAEALPPSAMPPRHRFPDTLVMSWIGRLWPAGVPPSWKKSVSSCVLRACCSAPTEAALISALHASCKRGGFYREVGFKSASSHD